MAQAGGEVYRDEYTIDTRRGTAGLKTQNRELERSEKLLNRGASAAGRFERATTRATRGAAAPTAGGRGGAFAARRGFFTGTFAGQIAARGLGGGVFGPAASAAGAAGGPALAGLFGAGAAALVLGAGAGAARTVYGAEAAAAEDRPLEAQYISARTAQRRRWGRRKWWGRLALDMPIAGGITMAIREAQAGREAERMSRAEMIRYLAEQRTEERDRMREAREIDRAVNAAMRLRTRDAVRREFSGGSSWGP